MKCYIITWKSITGKVWESERNTNTAKEALVSFRQSASAMKHPVQVLGIEEFAGRFVLKLVA